MTFTAMQAARLDAANKLREARNLALDVRSSIVWPRKPVTSELPEPSEQTDKLTLAARYLDELLSDLVPDEQAAARKGAKR